MLVIPNSTVTKKETNEVFLRNLFSSKVFDQI